MKGKSTFTKTEAKQIIDLITEKISVPASKQKGLRNKIRSIGFYASDFSLRGGYTVEDFRRVVTITGESKTILKKKTKPAPQRTITKISSGRKNSDENYVIDLCDEVLNLKSLRQHKFDFLLGDAGTRLPVDAYYPTLHLVIEFRERQHTEAVKHFDKPDVMTVSGVSRGEQRKIYDQRRRDVLPKHGIKLTEICYSDFEHDSRKKITRNKDQDLKIVRRILKYNI